MSSRLEKLFGRTPRQRRVSFGAVLAGLVIVPLAVGGLFAGALASADQRIDTIPAIVVNNDTMVNLPQPDGTTTPVLAGRQLVTELTGPRAGGEQSAGFDWTISNSADAADALAAGDAYAVLTIPRDFSASVTSLSGSSPQQAKLAIRTDDAHSYLAGSAAQSVGTAMTSAFGRAITAQYLTGFYAQLGTMGESLTSAADGASQVSSGVDGLATGLDSLAAGAATTSSGASSAAGGAESFASGVTSYTQGVDALATGLGRLSSGAAGLGVLRTGLPAYASGVQQSATGFAQLSQGLQPMLAANRAAIAAVVPQGPAEAAQLAQIDTLVASLNSLGAGLDALSAQSPATSLAGGGIGSVADGIAQSAAGAAQLAAGSGALRSGAYNLASGVSGLADGVTQLADGTAASAAGAHQLAGGAGTLATGLTSGARQASAAGDQDADATAKVVSEPVTVSTTRANEIGSIGPVIGMVVVPLGLWIGALAIFLLLRPVSPLALASTASTGRIVLRSLGRGFGIAAAQAVAITLLLHAALGVSWALLPSTLSFALLLALVFVAVHHALTVAFGRAGIVVSLVLLALQLTSAGGLYPIEIVAKPFQLVSPFLPLTWAVDGMQAIVSGVGGAEVAASAAALAAFALFGVLVSLWVVGRRRGARSFSFALSRS
ncbi:YhgE/Pip family protein [Glaciibacter sp. 2TAF33]|uniref:YhgE/Pip family protein n=1 Tax=Glaciibacter sp. 2TAF33 TaxID=3233015 RepID=UPI003F9346BB